MSSCGGGSYKRNYILLHTIVLSDAIKSIPQAILELILDIPSLDFFFKNIAISVLRLKDSIELKYDQVGHNTVLKSINLVTGWTFKTRISPRE